MNVYARQHRNTPNAKYNGRVYTIYFTATDGRGGVAQGNVKVKVPKNPNSNAIDDGRIYRYFQLADG